MLCSEEGIDEDEQRDADFTVPLQFRVTGSPNGKPDLQLQLLRLDFGSEVKHDPARHRHDSQQLLTIPRLQGAAPRPFTQHFFATCCPQHLPSCLAGWDTQLLDMSEDCGVAAEGQYSGHGRNCFKAAGRCIG